jgi:GNAT superfamily N-acetyltransferase
MVELLQHGALRQGKEDLSDSDPYLAALTEIQVASGNHLVVAEVDDEVVAMCQVIIFRHFQRGGGLCAEVESMHVHPDFRSNGIGERLATFAVDMARDAGCYRIQLTSDLRRSDAHRFYQRLDFEPSHLGFKRTLNTSD